MILDFGFLLLVNYLLHSSVWFGLAYLVQRCPGTSPRLRVSAWRCAAVGGVLSPLPVLFGLEFASTSLVFEPLRITDLTQATVPSLPQLALLRLSQPLAVILWAAGAAWLAARWLILGVRMRARISSRTPVRDPSLLALAGDLARRKRCPSPLRLTTCKNITSPVALGRREICLPPRVVLELGSEELRAILAHELEHLRRADPLILPISLLGACLCWPQPLWRVFRFHSEQGIELICDQAGSRDVADPSIMARSLVRISEWAHGYDPHVPALMSRHNELTERVAHLLSTKPAPRGRTETVAMYIVPSLMLTAALILPSVEVTASSEPVQREATVHGALDKTSVREIVRSNIHRISTCYDHALRRDPTTAGQVIIAFVIGNEGSVTESEIDSSTISDSELHQCMVSVLAGLHYPKPRDGGVAHVTYPFKLSP
ncbi:MAG: AgmX/PglI C-terminal domain-containing protein [Nannocystaceae bacterium]